MRYGFALVWQLALIAVAMETLCRLFIGRSPELVEDPRFGKITAPSSAVVQSFEGHSSGQTNSLGNLDSEMPDPRSADAVMVIGDSYTEARHVERADRFTDVLATLTSRRVYNVGHAGWSPVNTLGYLRANLASFSPRTIIVQVSANDLSDLVAAKRGHVVENQGVLEPVIPQRAGGGALAKLRAKAARSAFAGELVAGVVGLFGDKADDDGGGECAAPASLAVRAVPWLFGEISRQHRDTRVLYIPKLDYHSGCVDRCVVARDILAAGAAHAGVRFIDPTAAMCREFASTHQPLNGFWNTIPGTGHLNAAGHRVVARALADELAR